MKIFLAVSTIVILGKRVPKVDLKAAIENLNFSIKEYAVRTAQMMMAALDRANEA